MVEEEQKQGGRFAGRLLEREEEGRLRDR